MLVPGPGEPTGKDLEMLFNLNDKEIADGTVLLFGIRYVNQNPSPPGVSKVFTYAALKAGERWYLTGTGRVPQDAGWGAVRRWLDDPSRQVESVRVVTATETLFAYSPNEGRVNLAPSDPGWLDTSQS